MSAHKPITPRKLLTCLGLTVLAGGAYMVARSGGETLSSVAWFVVAFCVGGLVQLLTNDRKPRP